MTSARFLLALVAFAAAAIAVVSGDSLFGWVAIAICLAYLILRLVQRIRARKHRGDESDE